jgi:S1-C subfamily serine protease
MDKKDTFYWNDEKNRIDGFIPLDEENATRHAPDPEQAYKAYLEDAYSEYTDDAYEGPEEGPAFADVDSARQEADAAYGVQPQMQKKARKRKRPPRMVTMGILCLCIVLAAVTGAVSGIAVMQHYAPAQPVAEQPQMPAGTHAGMGAISATIVEASLQQAAETMPVETADAEQEGADIEQTATTNAGVIKTIMDSVVCIKTTGSVSTFYGPMDASGAGSGVIISEDGYIVTCAHVISNATKIEVQDSEDNVYQASLVAYSDKMDLALLKIDAEGLTPAVLGDSASYSAGDPIYVVGNPLGNFVLSVSQGIISGVDRRANIEGNEMRLTQVDAAVNPGNSGGGLFDSQGRLIGIVNAKNAGIDVEGMGFAIPIDTVREVLKAMLQRTDLTLDL